MATKLMPIGDNVLVKRLDAETKTKGGIVLPDSAKEKPKEGRVIALGEGRLLENGKRAPFQVKKNDRVLFGAYSGTDIKVDGEEFIIMSEEDVLAIVE